MSGSVDDFLKENPIEDTCKPYIDYNIRDDKFQVFWDCNTDFYVDPLKENPQIELIKEFETDRLVGINILGIKNILKSGY